MWTRPKWLMISQDLTLMVVGFTGAMKEIFSDEPRIEWFGIFVGLIIGTGTWAAAQIGRGGSPSETLVSPLPSSSSPSGPSSVSGGNDV